MASFEDLKYQDSLSAQGDAQSKADIYKQAAQQASDLYLNGDVKGASAILMKADPELAAKILQPLSTTLNPQVQGNVKGAEKAGELQALSAYDSTPGQISKAAIDAGKYEKADQNAKEARLGHQFDQQIAFKYQEAAEKSPIYKSGITVINEIPQLKSLLDDAYKNGGQSLAMLGPRIAKGLAGEVGVLTESDVTRYVQNPKLSQWILGGAEKKFEGKLTSQDYTNLLRLGTIMQGNAEKKLSTAYKQAATKMSRNTGMSQEDAEMLVNPTIDAPTKEIISSGHTDKKAVGPGSIVTVKGVQYKVGPDGDSLEEVK